jgi:hypothetical protein
MSLKRSGSSVIQDFSDLMEIWQVALANNDECWDVDFVELLDGGRVQKTDRVTVDPQPA